MKISSVKVYLLQSGMKMHPVVVEIETAEGVSGIGEAAIAYGAGGTAAAGMIKDLADKFLVGADARRIEDIWSRMYDHSFWAKGGGAIVFAGISAIEQALWDIKGKALGVPVYELLGGIVHTEIDCYANGWCFGCDTPAKFAKAGEKPARDGFGAIKCYPLALRDPSGTLTHVTRRAVDRDFCNLAYEKVKALRSAVGPKVDILLDLSGALTTDETIRLCRRYEDLDIGFIEEPADPFDMGAVNEVSRHVNIPIALGERVYTRHGFRRVFEPQTVHIVQPDIGNTGGIMETKKIAAMAEAYNMRVAPHNCGSPLMTAACIQLDACTTNFMIQEVYPYFPEEPDYLEILENPPERDIRNGKIAVSALPGLGVVLDQKAVAPFLWSETR